MTQFVALAVFDAQALSGREEPAFSLRPWRFRVESRDAPKPQNLSRPAREALARMREQGQFQPGPRSL